MYHFPAWHVDVQIRRWRTSASHRSMLLVPFAAQKNNKESHVADALQEASSDRSGADEACVLPVRIPVGVPAGIGTCRRVGAPIRVFGGYYR